MGKRETDELTKALWVAAKSAGGTLRLSPSVAEDFPGTKHAWVTLHLDPTFGDLVVTAHSDADSR